MTLEDFVSFFQICHSSDAPLHKQFKLDATETHEHNESNQEKDVADRKHIPTGQKTLSNHDDNQIKQDNMIITVFTVSLIKSCESHASITIGITWTIKSQRAC